MRSALYTGRPFCELKICANGLLSVNKIKQFTRISEIFSNAKYNCKELKQEEWTIAQDFVDKSNFGICVGAIDGKYINVQYFKNTGSPFYNYK